MELIRHDTNFDFLGKAKYFIVFSVLTVLGSFYLWFSTGDSKFGVDFKGGNEFVVSMKEKSSSSAVRDALEKGGVNNAIVQAFEGGGEEFTIRTGVEGDSKVTRTKVEAALKATFPEKYEIVRTEFVGPTIGQELRNKAIMATALALIGILLYVSFRFEFAFALGAVVALFHDVVVAMGAYLLAGHTVNMGTIAAALTIVGYSVNDTIVIFDRVREEILKSKDFDLVKLINHCVNVTLARTIVTSLLTLFSAAALLFLGGGAIADLSLYLFVGIIAGCYSTVFIAAPIVVYWERFRTRKVPAQ